MDNHDFLRALLDTMMGAVLFVVGFVGWLDSMLPHFVTWAGAIIALHGLYRLAIGERNRRR